MPFHCWLLWTKSLLVWIKISFYLCAQNNFIFLVLENQRKFSKLFAAVVKYLTYVFFYFDLILKININ